MNSPDLPILQAGWRDLKALRAHESVCFNQDDAWPLVELFSVLIQPKVVRLKIEVDKQIIGFFAGLPLRDSEYGSVLTISVLPDWQGQGLGKRLLSAGETAIDRPIIELTTRRSNAAAINLYKNAGYVQTGVREGYYFGEDGLIFEKHIR